MKILILGLGLMGSAYAYQLSKKGHQISGWDNDPSVNRYHEIKGVIHLEPFSRDIQSDILIVTLSPQATLAFFQANPDIHKNFKLITDLAGLKNQLYTDKNPLFHADNYVSHHPMTGHPKKGPEHFKDVVFTDKNVLIIEKNSCHEATDLLKEMVKELGFNEPYFMDATLHDHIITLNSHMPHVIVSVLTKHPHFKESLHTAGNSFRSLTHYASMNPELWSELLHQNKDYLEKTIDDFILELTRLKTHLASKEAIKDYLLESHEIFNKTKGH